MMILKHGYQVLLGIGLLSTLGAASTSESSHNNPKQHDDEDRILQRASSSNGRSRRGEFPLEFPTESELEQMQLDLDLLPRLHHSGDITIGIQFHVITDGTIGVLTDDNIDDSLSVLNEAFEPADISFEPVGPTTFTDNGDWYEALSGSEEEMEMMSALRVGNATTLNVYFNDASFSYGYGSFITNYACDPVRDGVVIWTGSIPGGPDPFRNEGDTLVNLAGRWLGLLPPYFGGCDGGDFVDDTPPQAQAGLTCNEPIPDTCPFDDLPDPVNNYMETTSDSCRDNFTEGQIERMRALWRFRVTPSSCGETLPPDAICGPDDFESHIDITVWNTFTDAVDTGGLEVIWDIDGPTSMMQGVEFNLFPSNPPDNNSPFGFYDIDVSSSSIIFSLRNNSGAGTLNFPNGTFDRYYFNFGRMIGSAEIVTDETSVLSAVEVLPPGFNTEFADPLNTGIPPPFLESGGLLLSVVPGADITELGQKIVICYSFAPPGEICGDQSPNSDLILSAWNTFTDVQGTGGVEFIYDFDGPIPMSDEVEFNMFPSTPPDPNSTTGFYDIDFTSSSIVYTLRNNSEASHLVFPDGSFDRYYLDLGARVAEASIVTSETTILSTVEILPPRFSLESVSSPGIPDLELTEGGILVSVVPGANITELGQNIAICYSLEPPPGLSCGPPGFDSSIDITVWNTITDADTQGIETIWDVDGPTSMMDGIEFNLFPSNPPDNNSPLGFYNIDVSSSSIVWTLEDNSAGSNLVFPNGTFNRYYFDFGAPVASASIVEDETGILSTVEILPPGFRTSLLDTFNTGLQSPSFPDGGLLVSVVPGANITQLGQYIVVCYSLKPGAICGDQRSSSMVDVSVWNSFTDRESNGGMEFMYDFEGPTPMSDEVEFHLFPSTPPDPNSTTGFYDIDISLSSIAFTLRDNTNASRLVFPPGTLDRYYFDFGYPVLGTSIVFSETTITSFAVSLLPGFSTDVDSNPGIPELTLEDGGIQVVLFAGANITDLGKTIVVCYSLDLPPPPPPGAICGDQSSNSDFHITVWNTFTDAVDTGGMEFLYDVDGPVAMSDDVEFNMFPSTPPDRNSATGFYDINFTSSSIVFTLRDNTNASHLVFNAGTFDRYYFDVGGRVAEASIVESETSILSTVEILPPGFTLDNAIIGDVAPFTLPDGGIRVSVVPAANITELGQNIVVCYVVEPPLGSECGPRGVDINVDISVVSTFTTLSDGQELVWDAAGPTTMMDGVEFSMFPSIPPNSNNPTGYYDIDIGRSNIVFTLRFPAQSNVWFHSYYFDFGRVVTSASIDTEETGILSSVEILPPGFSVDLIDPFNTGNRPPILPNGGLLVRIDPEANLVDLGQNIVICYSLAAPGAVCGDQGSNSDIHLTAWNTFTDAIDTGGIEFLYDIDGPTPMSDGVEFNMFPSTPPNPDSTTGFYDIDFTISSIVYTLRDNTNASHLVFPDGSFDRYYFDLGNQVADASIVGSETSILSNVDILPPGFFLDTGLGTGIDPISLPNGGILLSVGAGADITELGQNIVICYNLLGSTCGASGFNSNIDITVWNTFTDAIDTGGLEMIWDIDGPTSMMEGVEFDLFPSNPPDNNSPFGFYDIDVSSSNIIFTLRNNSAGSHLFFPNGTFDRYYFDFGAMVDSASIVADESGILSTVEILPPGFTVDLIDPFNTGIPSPNLAHGGLLVSVVPGANITELGQNIVVCYSLEPGAVCGDQGFNEDVEITAWNTFTDPVSTGGVEFFYDVEGPTPMSDEVEFNQFPSTPPDASSPTGFYDIDFSSGSIVYTLRDNTNASHLVFTEGSFDRYYFDLGGRVTQASIVESETEILSTVEILPPEYTLESNNPGVPSIHFPDGGIRVSVGPGANITELGQNIVVCYTLAPPPGLSCGDQGFNSDVHISAWNTFTDHEETGGVEFIYDFDGPTAMSDNVELQMFPSTPPNPSSTTGFYDIDVTISSIVFTLRDNTNATHLVFPDGCFDRYYLDFGLIVEEASLVLDETTILSTVQIVPPGFSLNTDSNPGIPPLVMENGGIEVTVVPGANITELGQYIVICYDLILPPPLGSSCGDTGFDSDIDIALWTTFTDTMDTGGLEAIYEVDRSSMMDGVEFSLSPPNPPNVDSPLGFYDVDITLSSIVMTLRDNLPGGPLIFPDGHVDRYYFSFGAPVSSAAIVADETSILSTVEVLPAGYAVSIIDPLGTGIRTPILSNGGIVISVVAGADITELEQSIVVCYSLESVGAVCGDQSIDEDVEISAWNTFTDPVSTGGVEFFYDVEGPSAMSDGVEFHQFPSTPPDASSPTGFYDIDFTSSSIIYTLRDNTNASHLVFTEGSFDRYYFDLGLQIADASIVVNETQIASTVEVLPPGYELESNNPGIPSINFAKGGIRLSVVAGADISVLGRKIVVCYSVVPPTPPLGTTCGDQGSDSDILITTWNTLTDNAITSGVQFVYDSEGPTAMSDGVEFVMFPSTPPDPNSPTGFYDIDITSSSIVFTLRDNTNASRLVFPWGTFDRYYFDFGRTIAVASPVSSETTIPQSFVQVLPHGFFLDSDSNPGIPPIILPNGGILVTIFAGANITEVPQNLVFCYTLR